MDFITNNCVNGEYFEFTQENHSLNLKYYEDEIFNKKINKLCIKLNKKLKINLSYCKNITDVGLLKNVKKITITTKMHGLYLLKNLKILTVEKKILKREIKKLLKVNNKTKIKFI